MKETINSSFLGLAIGDALGVPVEFKSRNSLKDNPVSFMLGYGCWSQPKGTWSDDSSLAFCLAESLCAGYNLNDIANKMLMWYQHGYWGAHGEVFDIGGTTRHSLLRLSEGCSPLHSGNMFESDNGNGSLMRILPLAFYLSDLEDKSEVYKIVKEVSSITHAHFRSVFACFIYIIFAIELIRTQDKLSAYKRMQEIVNSHIIQNEYNTKETELFSRILHNDISIYNIDEIWSDGYVLHTLEASLWCFMKTNNYKDAVLDAVNLGGDTDTVACITGGIAGLYYGVESIPLEWLDIVVKRKEIELLAMRYFEALNQQNNELESNT